MIVVDYAGGVMPAINHSPWNGLTLADLVMPFFLFIVGVSLALAYKVVLYSLPFKFLQSILNDLEFCRGQATHCYDLPLFQLLFTPSNGQI